MDLVTAFRSMPGAVREAKDEFGLRKPDRLASLFLAGGVLGIVLRRILPEEHFVPASEAVIKLVTGFVMTMTGIILGMLVSSAKSSYDGQKLLVAQMSSDVILLDHALCGVWSRDRFDPQPGTSGTSKSLRIASGLPPHPHGSSFIPKTRSIVWKRN